MESGGINNNRVDAQTVAVQTGVAMLKKSLELQEQTTEQLLASIPKPASPSHLGNVIDVTA